MVFPPERTKQFLVQFACRIPARKELQAAERKALENVLRGLDSDLFQIFHEEHNAVNLFQVSRQHPVGPITITVPSFVLANDAASLFSLIMTGGTVIKNKTFDTSGQNKKMAGILFAVQNTLKGLHYHRAGKIFEIVLGPFSSDEKPKVLSKLVAHPLEEVGELTLTFAKYTKLDESMYNFKTVITYNQLELGHQFDLIVRVDINNRQLEESMEPGQIERGWGEADRQIAAYIDSLLGYTS